MINLPSMLSGPHVVGQPLIQAYLATWLGRQTFGRVLNVGAGEASVRYEYARRLTNTEYHTLEISPQTSPTYVGDVCSMPSVPSASYDWVLAIAVLEHVRDMQAAVAEIERVLKPGGYAYISIPLHNDIHFGTDFEDYWRVTPFGFRQLLGSRFSFSSIEYWGDCVVDPVSIAVVARKEPAAQEQTSQYYFHIEGGLDTVDRLIDGAAPFRWSMPVYRMRMDTIDYIRQVRDWRVNRFTQDGVSVSIRQADQLLFRQAAMLEGYILIENGNSAFCKA